MLIFVRRDDHFYKPNKLRVRTNVKKLLIVLALLAAGTASAQKTPVTEANYRLAERFSPDKVNQMIYSTEVNPNWLEHSNRFWYSYKTAAGTKWYLVDADKGKKTELFDVDKMAAEITRIVKDAYDGQHLPIGGIRFTEDEKTFRFAVTSKAEEVEKPDPVTGKPKKEKKKFWFEYDLATGKLTELKDHEPEKAVPHWAAVSPDRKYAVYAKNFNLYCMDWENLQKAAENDKDSTIVERQLTTDGVRYNGYGWSVKNSADNQEEKAKERVRVPIVWSPDSKHFVAGRTDERDVKELWVIYNTAQPRPTLETYKYQMAGDSISPVYHLSLFDIGTGEARPLDIDAFEQQSAGVVYGEPVKFRTDDYTVVSPVWMGSNDEFFFTRTSRDMKRTDICRVDVKSGKVTPVIEERFNTYLEDRRPEIPNGIGGDIIHWSERDGWAHLYRFNRDGELINQITSGPYHVESVVKIDPEKKVIYFTANAKEEGINPYYEFLYRVNFDGSGLKLLSPGDFFHKISMDENHRYFVDNYSRVNTVPKATLYNTAGKKILDLEEADFSKLFESGYKFPEPFVVKADDGITDIYGVMYKPYDFDSTKVYPLIEYVSIRDRRRRW